MIFPVVLRQAQEPTGNDDVVMADLIGHLPYFTGNRVRAISSLFTE